MAPEDLRTLTFIEDERLDQYKTKHNALLRARRLTRETGVRHTNILTITYRMINNYPVPKLCWGICIV